MGSEWIVNTGVEPSNKNIVVEVVFACGGESHGYADVWQWENAGDPYDIVKWRYRCGAPEAGDVEIGTEGQITHWRLHKENASATIGDLLKVQVTKDTNPKEQIGLAKLPLHLWSPLASAYGSLGLLNGMKYGYGNYKATPVLASIYIAAIKRHLSAWEEGQECDPVDGVPHFGAILANVAILLESRAVGTMVDDRQIQGGYLKEVEKLTEIANSVQELHKHRTPYHYSIKDTPKDA